MIIKNAKVYSDGCRFVEKDLIIRDGRIVFGAAPQEGENVIDAGGAYALPGLVDIHFHGAVGHDFCDADEAGLQAIADFEASKGVLAICPATMTFSEEILNGIMDVAAAHKNERGADLVDAALAEIADGDSVASWARAGVVFCYLGGIMNGKDATHFAPTGMLTRAQLAQVFFNLYNIGMDEVMNSGEDPEPVPEPTPMALAA